MITNLMRILLIFSCCLVSLMALAQENVPEHSLAKNTAIEKPVDHKTLGNQEGVADSIALLDSIQQTPKPQEIVNKTPQVGKHVMANMDAGSMILSLLMVLVLIILCALVLKRFNLTQQGVSQLKVVTSLSLGAKERVVVIQAGEQQLLLGVTAQQVTLIERLAEPLVTPETKKAELPKGLLSFLAPKKI